ncbi:MAG: TVP38/TMEM64 family protein [Gammaproteobacteria bacterium]|nr:TVP38/TMEM64 family protein [Gammaproteobacteria bacterium]
MAKRILRIFMPIILLSGFLWFMQGNEPLSISGLYHKVESVGYWARFYFIVLYCFAVVLLLPTPVFTLAGGALFGPMAILYSLFAICLGSSLAFLISRYLNSDWLYHFHDKRLQHVISGVDDEGWRFIAMVRLLPFMPFDLINYALGLTRISFMQYIITTTICLIPAITAYSLVGHLGGTAIQGKEDLWDMGIVATLLLLLVGYLPRLLGLLGVGFNIRYHHHQLSKRE